ncbi:PDZ and LIM domain protein Zasp isoform X2 [Bradysia coprophila]|uniref:PDZ and LIM domain protein Zasp isoform X2 n=1 Tax=Bradysia coprophila TaxID=38358 RepID=UPI00187D76CA|nr:PDZ and LIM domain protein Zasp isoform X2 [Bradysia coprophila]
MAQLITVRLSRVDAQPWGLRLQGGKDFGTPLVVQKVNIGSIADQAGLIAGDSVIKVNNVDVFSLRHKDAQDIIVRSGNSFEITIQRGGSTWRPSVTPTGAIPSPTPSYGNQINTVTKTSLAHKQQESQHIGCGYNNAARPFQNGSEPVKSIVNKQYNTPVGIYSEESIAETLSAQAEVLAGGVLGVNFKKNEKVYNSAGSEVLKALQESENDPAEPAGTNFYWTASHAVGGAASSRSHTPSQFQGAAESNKNGNGKQEDVKSDVRNVVPVQPKPVTAKPIQAPVTAKPIQSPVVPKPEQSPKVSPCDECGSSIPGVFVRIKDKNLHVDCFKCATCGTSLKNQGYFNLNNKLYCDVHAKLAAVNNPPPGTEGYKPVPIGPNTKLSASTISAALSAHHGNLPHQNGTSHNNNHDYLLPNHSRTSSAASSFGSSYVSSTDSNKASPSTVSPVHSRQGSQNSTTSNLSLNYRQNADEIDKNVINASYHNNSTLPRYQSVFNAEIKGYYNDNNQKSSILDDINAKEMAIVDGGFNGKTSGHDESIYGTIRNTDEKGKESEDVIYRTMDGGVIRSVHPPGKGKGTKYQLPSNLGSPKPYSYGSGPPPAGPKSPSSYPPPNWSQPKQQAYAPPQQTYAPPQQTYAPPQQTYAPPQQTYAPPQQTYAPPQQTYAPPKPTYAPPQNYSSPASNFNNNNFGSNTLPRSVGQSAPVSSASTIEETKSSSFATQSQQYQSTVSTTIPTVQEPRRETVSVPSQSLESPDKREHQRAVSPYRAHTPSLINKPAPAIPYYQQNLVAEECSATSSLLFDPRTQSPRPDGCKSPAPGPPPNPLRIHAPRIKSPDPAEQYDTVTQTIDTGISNQFQAQSAGKLLSQHQTLNQSGMQSYVVKPEIVQQSQLGNLSIQSRSNQSELNEQKRSDFQNSSTTQIGNTQIQRNTRVVEEFEHSQKAKTVEVYKSTGRPPIRSITAEPTTPKTSCFLQKSGQTDLENAEEKISIKSSGPGFVAREARRLSTNSQYKADLAEYQSTFPQFSCETPPCAFPTKSFHPILEEPKFQTYNVNKRAGAPAPPPGYQQISKPILTKSTQHLSNKLAQITESSASSTLTSATTAMTQPVSSSTPYKPPIAIPVPAFKPPMTSANDFKPSQSAANNFKPTPSSGPGFKPPNTTIPSAVVSNPTPASAGPNKGLTFGATSAPKRGRGILSKGPGPGGRVPQCGCCNAQIRGPFITALGRIWCPDHFVCVSQSCRRPLADIGFVEEKGDLYCEYCFEKYLAPPCDKCGAKIKGDCLNAIGKHYHPECFVCTYCGKLFGNSPFFLEEGQAYCEADWNELFTTKCFACGFPVEAGDRWVEALSHNYHSQCFNCTMCKKNLEGQSFFAKGGRPYCKNHAR